MATTLSSEGLAGAWAAVRSERRAALIPYLTAGFPDLAGSVAALRLADEFGDIIEVGVPFSDPVADGPTIQRSTFDALAGGMTLAATLGLIRQARVRRPVVVFSYLNPILRYGVSRFLDEADGLGVAGLLLTDMPAGADAAIEAAIAASPIALIRVVAPTTTQARLEQSLADARGFVYLIARLGVTGVSASLSDQLPAAVARVRAASTLPVAVGFGISTPAQAAAAGEIADGVVVGSALVDALRRTGAEGARELLSAMRAALQERP